MGKKLLVARFASSIGGVTVVGNYVAILIKKYNTITLRLEETYESIDKLVEKNDRHRELNDRIKLYENTTIKINISPLLCIVRQNLEELHHKRERIYEQLCNFPKLDSIIKRHDADEKDCEKYITKLNGIEKEQESK